MRNEHHIAMLFPGCAATRGIRGRLQGYLFALNTRGHTHYGQDAAGKIDGR